MRRWSALILSMLTTLTLVNGQVQDKSKLFLGIGLSASKFNYKQEAGLYGSPAHYIGNIPLTLGYVVNERHQLQLEYYLEDYFVFGPKRILYNQIMYVFPSYYYNNAKALRLSYGRRFQLSNFYIIPKGGITCGFLGTISLPYEVIEWQFLLHTTTFISEITEYSTFQPFLAFGVDLESPKFLKSFTATLNGYYNLAVFPAVKEDISFIVDREIIYYNSITTHLNHGNMMVGLRYYFSL